MNVRYLLAAALLAGPALAEPLLSASEIRPILGATKADWVALRDYDGQDLLYFTALESWRCGLSSIGYAVNGGEVQVWETEPCHDALPQPNAFTDATRLRYAVLPEGAVTELVVTLTYADGETDSATFNRAELLMP